MSRTSLSLSLPSQAQLPQHEGPPLAIDDQVRGCLEQHEVFQGVASSILDKILDRMQVHLFKAGDQIISEGEESRALFFIIKGVVTIGSEASESTIAELGPGLFFGETGALFGGKRTMTVRAKTKALLVAIGKDRLYDALKLDPTALKAVKMKAEKRIECIEQQLEQLSSGAARHHASPSLASLKPAKKKALEKNSDVQASPGVQTNRRGQSRQQQQREPHGKSPLPSKKDAAKSRRSTLFMSSNPYSFDYQDAPQFGKKSSMSSVDATPAVGPDYGASSESANGPFSSFSPDQDFDKVFQLAPSNKADHMASINTGPRASVAVWNDVALSKFVGPAREASESSSEQSSCALPVKARRRSSLSLTEFNSHTPPSADRKVSNMTAVHGSRPSQLSPPSPLSRMMPVTVPAIIASAAGMSRRKKTGSMPTKMDPSALAQHSLTVTETEHVHPLATLSDLMQSLSLLSSSSLSPLPPLAHRFVLTEPSRFETLDFGPFHSELTDDKLLAILKFAGAHIRHLSLQDCWDLTDQSMKHTSDYCHQLVSLNIQSCWNITTEGMANLCNPKPLADSAGPSMSTTLTRLNLSNCTKLDDAAMHHLASCFRNIVELNVAYCKCLTNESLLMIATRWSSIKKLSLQRCTGLNDDAWAPLLKLFTENKHALFEKLEDLDLSDGNFITNLTIQTISQLCPNLKRLNLSFCCSLTSQAIGFLVQGCKYIEDLDLSFCSQAVTDDSLMELLQQASHLTCLKIRSTLKVTDRFVEFLLKTTKVDEQGACSRGRLKVLNISNCHNISEGAIAQLSQEWKVIRNEGSLQQRQASYKSLPDPRRISCYV